MDLFPNVVFDDGKVVWESYIQEQIPFLVIHHFLFQPYTAIPKRYCGLASRSL